MSLALSMTDLASEFPDYLRSELMLAERTRARYEAIVRDFIAFAERAGFAVDAARRDDVLHFLRSRSSADAEPSRAMWNLRLAALRALYGLALKEEVMAVNPAALVERRKLARKERFPLSLSEMLAIVDAAARYSPEGQKARNVALFQVFLHSSLRAAEVVSLTLDQVDLDLHAFLSVRVKGDKRLSVLFNDVVAEALARYLAERKTWGLPDAVRTLFVSKRGGPLSVRTLEYLVPRYAELAGIRRRVTPHDLRHSSLSELAEEGTPLEVVRDHAGHESVKTTELYVHRSKTHEREAVDRLGTTWKRAARCNAKKLLVQRKDTAGNAQDPQNTGLLAG